ncbi:MULTISPECIES: SPFH domain-containing protein [unclassified Streptomyces]|uniref:SPFH domain-containing protein n=1 Tax=unclassified Streptomyces TaxID=2593676 RepID=UPI000B2334F6|nr:MULTISPECIES: SPFH domain-containing protein [unclassified Streptomyces]
MTILITVVVVLVALVLITLAMAVRIVRQYERGVLFRFGRLTGTREPGLRFIIPFVDVLHRVSLRIVTMPIQSQGVITQVVGQHTLDRTPSETDRINLDIRQMLDVTTTERGVEVTLVELKDIQLPESMKRATARQAEAEREERAKIISAEGESLAAAAPGDASDTMMAHPPALQLRNLQSLIEIGVDKKTTVLFPAPLMSTIGDLGAFLAREATAAATAPPAPKPVFDLGKPAGVAAHDEAAEPSVLRRREHGSPTARGAPDGEAGQIREQSEHEESVRRRRPPWGERRRLWTRHASDVGRAPCGRRSFRDGSLGSGSESTGAFCSFSP